jgi:hypothetical protein
LGGRCKRLHTANTVNQHTLALTALGRSVQNNRLGLTGFLAIAGKVVVTNKDGCRSIAPPKL